MQASLTLRPSATRVFAAKKVQVRSAIDPMNNALQRAVQRCQRRAHASRESAWRRCRPGWQSRAH